MAVLARLGRSLIPSGERGEVAFTQALVLDVTNGVSDDLGFGQQADIEQVLTQKITLAERSNLSAMQSFVRGGIEHAVAFQA
jgi:hypothetical protein